MTAFYFNRRTQNQFSLATKKRGIVKMKSGKNLESMWTAIRNEFFVDTALNGDSIIDIISVIGVQTYSLSGGKVRDMYELMPTLKSYKKIIVSEAINSPTLKPKQESKTSRRKNCK